jgi:predicted Zn finger-like uncharacterized protein
MILECPSCTARFLVADAIIPQAGRTVRCGACSNQWFVEPAQPPVEALPIAEGEAPPPAPSEETHAKVDFATLAEAAAASPEAATPKLDEVAARKLPVVAKRQLPVWPFMTGGGVLAASWLIMAFIAYFPHGQRLPVVRGLYSAFGVTDTDGLVFEEITMESKKTETRTQYILAGSVANHAASLRELPKVRVELKDKDGEVVWARAYPVNHQIKPGEVYPFRIEDIKTSFGDKVTTVVIDLGHPLELAVR